MLPSEAVRVSLFVSSVFAVYFAAGALVLKSARRRFSTRAAPPTPRETKARRVIFALAALGSLCIAYGTFVEPYWLEVTRTRVESPKIRAGSGSVRIALVSDLHSDPKPRLEERLPQAIAAEKPDLIAFTGDSINSPKSLPVFKICMERLAAVAPVFAVRGNWDAEKWRDIDLFGGTGALELNGIPVHLTVRGVGLTIVGLPLGSHHPTGELLGKLPPKDFTIFLYHTPDRIFEAARSKLDLYLAGHTHGGQVALPFYGALVTASRFGKRFEAGLYRVDHTWLYVNRGIGMEGNFSPRVRFCARPEVTIIEVWPPP
jgi:uncharacterized protein